MGATSLPPPLNSARVLLCEVGFHVFACSFLKIYEKWRLGGRMSESKFDKPGALLS